MNDEQIAKKIREIANLLETLRIKFYNECELNTFYLENKNEYNDLLFSYQSKIRDIANEIDPI